MTEQKKYEIAEGTVIHGTFQPGDLIPAFQGELQRLDPTDSLIRAKPDFDDELDTQALVIELMDALDRHAPPGMYFGPHPGDGSDFGFWQWEED